MYYIFYIISSYILNAVLIVGLWKGRGGGVFPTSWKQKSIMYIDFQTSFCGIWPLTSPITQVQVFTVRHISTMFERDRTYSEGGVRDTLFCLITHSHTNMGWSTISPYLPIHYMLGDEIIITKQKVPINKRQWHQLNA